MKDGAPSGLGWDVVESLPVSEDIKKQKGDWRAHVAATGRTAWSTCRQRRDRGDLLQLHAGAGLDPHRSGLAPPDSATCMRFDLPTLPPLTSTSCSARARHRFPPDIVAEAARRFAGMDDARRAQLAGNVVFGLPGAAETFTLEDVRHHMAEYDGIGADRLRAHLIDFLAEVAPLAQDLGLRLCCHPDDPPFSLLGLPRVMSTEADYKARRDGCGGSACQRHHPVHRQPGRAA
jgi:mannonate dehydratase